MTEDDFYSVCRFNEAGIITLPQFWLNRVNPSDGVVLIPRALSSSPGYFATDIWPNDSRFETYVQSLDRMIKSKSLVSRQQKRRILSAIFYKELDAAGRLHVNRHHRDISRLGSSVACVDMMDHLELWNIDAWQKRCREMENLISGAG